MEIKKIQDKVEFDVQAQGCWDDCTVYPSYTDTYDASMSNTSNPTSLCGPCRSRGVGTPYQTSETWPLW